MAFFFSWNWHATQTVGGSHAIELTDADRETKALGQEALYCRTGGRTMVLAIVHQPGENLTAELNRVSVSPFDQRLLTFVLHALEQPVDRRSMHRDGAANPCLMA